MNIEGNTYLFYDKYCDDHGYPNPKTINVTLDDLYSSDYNCITGIDAINEFNKYGGMHKISYDLDLDFYQLSFFTIPKTDTENEKKFMTVCVNHDKLKKYIDNIPNKDFLINACS